MLENMLQTDPIDSLVDQLPTDSVTVYMLKGLDYLVPGQWQNLTGFQNTIKTVTGETDPARIQAISKKAIQLYNDPNQGYKKAIWLYQKVDITDQVLAAAALANKVGDKISFLSFLSNLTPKPEILQSIDLSLKVAIEMIAYGLVNGLPKDGIQLFAQSLLNYSRENVMRMVTLMCVDGIIPLGANFADKTTNLLGEIDPIQLEQNAIYQQVGDVIPGENTAERFTFIQQAFNAVKEWMKTIQTTHNITPESLLAQLKTVIQFTDDKIDYVGAFLDAATNYYSHTGTQSVARQLIVEANKQVPNPLPSGRPSRPDRPNRPNRPDRPGPRPRPRPRPRFDEDDEIRGASPKELEKLIEGYLAELGVDYGEDDDGNIYFTAGSTGIYILIDEWKKLSQSTVAISAAVVSDVKKIPRKVGLDLLEQNYDIPLGFFAFNKAEDVLYFAYSLLAETVNAESLAITIDKIVEIADDMDEDLAKEIDGLREMDYEGGRKTRFYRLSDDEDSIKSEDDVWDDLTNYLDELGFDYEEEDDELAVEVGDMTVYIEAYELDDDIPQVVVDLSAIVAEDVDELSKKDIQSMLEESWELPIGGLSYDADDEIVYLSYLLLGDTLTPSLLEEVIKFIAKTAEKLG